MACAGSKTTGPWSLPPFAAQAAEKSLARPWPVRLVAVDHRGQFAVGRAELIDRAVHQRQGLQAVQQYQVRKMVPSSLIVRSRMLVPTGQIVTRFWMVTPLAMAIDSSA